MIVGLLAHGVQISIRLPTGMEPVAESIRADYGEFLNREVAGPAAIRIFVSRRSAVRGIGSKVFGLRTRYSRSRGWRTKYILLNSDRKIIIRANAHRYFAAVVGEGPQPIYEMIDRLLLSSLGERLDARGIHRLHAFSYCMGSQAVVITGRSGCGKSYLAAQADRDSRCRIFSDEVTLLRRGRLLPFPIALSADSRCDLPGHPVRRRGGPLKIRRRLSHAQLGDATPPFLLVLASRTHEQGAAMTVRRASVLRKIEFVLGTGLGLGQMQMVEFTLRADNFFRLPAVFISRVRSAWTMVKSTPVVTAQIPDGIKWSDFHDRLIDRASELTKTSSALYSLGFLGIKFSIFGFSPAAFFCGK